MGPSCLLHHLFDHLPIHLAHKPTTHPSTYPRIHQGMHPTTHPSIHLIIHLPTQQLIHPLIHLARKATHSSIYPSTHLPFSPTIHPSSTHPFFHHQLSKNFSRACYIYLSLLGTRDRKTNEILIQPKCLMKEPDKELIKQVTVRATT